MNATVSPLPRPAPSPEVTAIRRRGLSVGLATGLYGLSFGALATGSGLDVWQAMVLSAVLFSGGSQFAFVGVVAGGGSALGAVLAATLLGIRNMIYGVTLSGVLPRGGVRGALRSLLTIDESTATALSGTTPAAQRAGFWSAGIWVWVFWNLFSLIGALGGQFIADPRTWGLDGAAAAAFLALLWPRLRRRDAVAIAVAAAFVATITTPVLPAGLPVLAAAVVAVVAGLAGVQRSGA
ncbi:AzlC family ABC transporter permease [Brachybacterium sp. AOP25-B2-12]|uniref:AzlC family ABC transporter permease n=1 Tax=Brachybacterium sp. AOP25-B2-12 TaxID=3457710 RepID=UPI004033C4CB